MPSDGTFASRPNTTEKITILNSGRMMAQARPRTVCLYKILTSRRTMKYKRSLYARNSFQSTNWIPFRGSMIVCCTDSGKLTFFPHISHFFLGTPFEDSAKESGTAVASRVTKEFDGSWPCCQWKQQLDDIETRGRMKN